MGLRRDRGALTLSFVLPVVFFSIFATIFGGRRDTTPKVSVVVVDEDHSRASERLIRALEQEKSLVAQTLPEPVKAPTDRPDFDTTGWTTMPDGSAWTMQEPFGAYTW